MLDVKVLATVAVGAVCMSLLAGSVMGKELRLPKCRKNHQPVSLQIITDVHAGWTVNAANAHAASNAAWFPIPPSNWIGPAQTPPGTYTYVVHFSAPNPRGPMMVSAQWAADNCGVSLTGGTGTPVPTGPCYEGDKDFVASHTTTASFSTADSSDPNPSITFVTSNEGGPTGMTGIFTVTAECLRD